MTLHLTPDMLRAAYDYLNETEPFNRWNLPSGEDVTFRVVRSLDNRGLYWRDGGKHYIAVSSGCIGTTDSLMKIMGHEMIHLHEQVNRACGRGMHSRAFWRWAGQVCRRHGWDVKLF